MNWEPQRLIVDSWTDIEDDKIKCNYCDYVMECEKLPPIKKELIMKPAE